MLRATRPARLKLYARQANDRVAARIAAALDGGAEIIPLRVTA
jgi:hypothetical protein